MEKEPLLAYNYSRSISIATQNSANSASLCSLPEENEINVPLTPSELKDRIIFGPASPSCDNSQNSFFNENLSITPKIGSSSSSLENIVSSVQNVENDEKTQSWLLDPNSSNCFHKKGTFHRSKTAPAMSTINDLVHHEELSSKPLNASSSSIIKQAFFLLLVYLTCGVIIYCWNVEDFRAVETNPVVDALYFCIVTMCTIGYGDIIPTSTATKMFSILFVLVGFGFIDILLSGMVCYMLDLQENYLLRDVKEGRQKDNPCSYIIDFQKGRMRIRMKVGLALGVVVVCVAVGAIVMHIVENMSWVDSFYLSVLSVTTVGYGDKAFNTMSGRMFASIWLLVSTLTVARAFLYLTEARVDKRNRRMAKWVLGQDMTVSQFLAADIDNNGFVTKSEYVIYKLKEMGKISEKDIMQICKIFERIDSGNCGKITLGDLMEGHL